MFEAGEDYESVVELTFKMVPIKASKKNLFIVSRSVFKKSTDVIF